MVNHHFHYFLHQKLPNWGPKKASNRSPDWPPLWPGTPGAVDCHIFRQGLAMVLHIPTNVQYVTYNNSQKGPKRHLMNSFGSFIFGNSGTCLACLGKRNTGLSIGTRSREDVSVIFNADRIQLYTSLHRLTAMMITLESPYSYTGFVRCSW
jgi:hypothetical protein